jgi:ribonucleoside-triphosphate reductase
MNEACLNAKWLRKDLTNPEAQKFTQDVLNHMRERLSDYQEKYGDLYNLEATPAESTSYRLAKHDKKHYPEIITAPCVNGDTPYYTNSSHLPVGYTEDIFTALDIQDELQTLYTSGTVFHAFLGEKLPSWKSAANLVRKIAENYKLPYYTMSPTYSVCKNHGYISGEVYTCPDCGEKTEVYSRITGYYRPVQNWNDGKSQEYRDRKVYDVETSKLVRSGAVVEDKVEEKACDCESENGIYLFKTATCPNCKIAMTFLDKAGVKYEQVLATQENKALVDKFGIMQAPTLVVVKDGNVEKFVGVSDIKKYLGV